MTKERVCANSLSMSRRSLLSALPATSLALVIPTSATAAEHSAVLGVLHELESWQGWEAASVAAAKSYAAHRLRVALEMELPDPKYARLHLEYQAQTFEDYTRSKCFQRDRQAGKVMSAPPPVSSLLHNIT